MISRQERKGSRIVAALGGALVGGSLGLRWGLGAAIAAVRAQIPNANTDWLSLLWRVFDGSLVAGTAAQVGAALLLPLLLGLGLGGAVGAFIPRSRWTVLLLFGAGLLAHMFLFR